MKNKLNHVVRTITIAILLQLYLYGAGAAYATEATTQTVSTGTETYSFVFRDGITWDTTPEQMMNIEGTNDFTQNSMYDLTNYKIYDVKVSRYQANLFYLYNKDELLIAGYDLSYQDLNIDDLDYLKDALCVKYGDPNVSDAQVIISIMLALEPHTGTDQGDINYFYGWRLDDGTLVAIYDDDFNSTDILYINENRVYMYSKDSLNTEGL